MEVGGGEEPAGFEVAEGVLRVGEELLVEGPARPSVLHVPVHVQHEHVQRQPARFVIVDDLEDVLKIGRLLFRSGGATDRESISILRQHQRRGLEYSTSGKCR